VAITPVAPVGDRKNRQDSDPRSGYPEVVHSTLAGAGRAPERTGVRTPASKEVCAVTTVQELTPQPVVTVRDSVAPEALLALFERRFAQLAGHLAQRGAAPAGQPFAIYHAMSAEAVDIELGMPVVDPVAGGGEVVAGELPAGRAAVLTHHGPYDGGCSRAARRARSTSPIRARSPTPPDGAPTWCSRWPEVRSLQGVAPSGYT
jgi:hypothetical protein